MSSVSNAVEKIRDEMVANNNTYVRVVGDFLMKHLERHPEAAEKILAEGKTIRGSLSAMREEARKHQVDGCGVLTDEEGFAVVLRYYGIVSEAASMPAPAPSKKVSKFDVDLDELLGKR
jgi:hypothetical protein